MSVLFLSDYFVDTLTPILKWVTIALFSALIVALVVAFFVNKFGAKKVIKVCFFTFLVYAFIIGILLLILEIVKHYNSAYLEENWVSSDIIGFVFVPILITLVLSLLSFVGMFIVLKKFQDKKSLFSKIIAIVLTLSIIATIVLIAIFYSNNIVGDGYYTAESSKFNNIALYAFALLLVVASIVIAFFVDRKGEKGFTTRSLAFAGICVSLSFGLSFIKLFEMPQGGSVTLVSMLPIMIFSFTFGMKKGLIVGLVYGLLQAVQDPFIVHPAQFFLDYPIAFAVTAFAGLLKDTKLFNNIPQLKFAISAVIGGTLRAVSHILSGVFAFGAYAVGEGATNFFLYSLVYNSYVFIDVALVIVAGAILFSSKSFKNELNKFNPTLFGEIAE